MAALAVFHLCGPGTEGVVPVAAVAIRGSDFLTTGVDAAVGAGLVLLLFGQMAVAAEF